MSLEGQVSERRSGSSTVFLSYAHEDQACAQKIVKALEAQGFSIWWDGLISGGHDFAERIEQALATSDAIVVLWSKTSIHSHWVRDEASIGRERQCLVPLSIDGSEPPLGFRQIQSIDFNKWHGRPRSAPFRALCRSIYAAAGTPQTRILNMPSLPTLSRRHALVGGGAAAVALAAGAAYWLPGSAPADGASIAVLPFRNLGGDAEDGYFSDGLAEELRATLSRIDQLAVVAEASSDRFRDGKADARTMAKALGVAFLMEGSVRRSSDLIRVSTRIVDGETGFDKWSQSFDRNVSDALSIQSAIAAFVTDALLAGLAREQRPSERIGGTRDPKAFDAFLRGSALYRSAGGETSDFAALKKFDDAIAIDAKYAAAHAARSRALTVIANNYASPSEIPAYYQRSIGAAQAAVHLAPRMAEGHSALGFALFNGQLDALAAAGPYQRSFEFGFGNAEILSAYAIFAARTGRFDDGRQAIARAERLDPLNPTVFRNAGLLEYSARNYDGAEAPFRTALSLNPKARIVHSALGDIAIMQGDAAAARKLYEQEPDDASRWRGLAIADMKLGRTADAQRDYEMLVKVGEGVSHYQQAQVAAQWGKVGDALDFLERALALRDAGLVRLRNDPLLDALRQEPRFTSIEQKIGFA